MTPEEVEARLQLLKTPEPSEGLRARCLAPQAKPARARVLPALAASLLVIALTGWLILTPPAPVKAPDGILVEPGTASPPRPDDPRLQEKLDALFRKNPGKAILVVRVFELKNGAFLPVTKGFTLKILLDSADQETGRPDGPHSNVDGDGTLLLVATPGRYRGKGYERSQDKALSNLSFVWQYGNLTAIAGDVIHLSDAIFASWMEWAAPDEGSELSLKADPAVGWKAFSEVRSVRLGIERVTRGSDGIEMWETQGFLKRDFPGTSQVRLSDLSKASRTPFRAGEALAVSLEGYDREGKKVTGCKTKRRFTVKE